MRRLLTNTLVAAAVFLASQRSFAFAQDLRLLHQQWEQTVRAVQDSDAATAQAAFARFNASIKSYVLANGLTWQVEYLAGSLDCLLPQARTTGAQILSNALQTSRGLPAEVMTSLQASLDACNQPAATVRARVQPISPQDLVEVSTHYQAPGIRGDMKGGGGYSIDQESVVPVSPIAPAELAARLFPADHADAALEGALGRLPPGSSGALVPGFAVTAVQGTHAQALGIGNCLRNYAAPLRTEFEIQSSNFVITAYAVPDQRQVYDFARQLHGLQLPLGVIAYSVTEDMSLVSVATETACGSMAHELVHLLIRQNFSAAPAWLEEGLASEIAIAAPTANRLRFGWSWRDTTLHSDWSSRPSVGELLNIPWSQFNASHISGLRRAEATQAMAAVFIRYLDARSKLAQVYFGVRDHHVSPDLSSFRSYQAILEETLGMSIDAVDHDFDQWFTREAKLNRVEEPTVEITGSGIPGAAINAPAPHRVCEVPNSAAQQTPCKPEVLNQQAPAPKKE